MPHTAAPARKFLLLLAIAWFAFIAGCARMPGTGITALKPSSYSELEHYLATHPADVDEFRLRGPFAVATRTDVQLPAPASEHATGDLYLASAPGKAPLVILLHGHDNSKDDHAYQAMHLATWGIHSLALQLPNNGPWVRNGKTLATLVAALQKRPELLDSRIDPARIIVAGHSFGAFSAAIALAEGAPAIGAILLDPATAAKGLAAYLRKIDKPVLVISADAQVSAARGHGDLSRYIRSNVAEISIRDATHEDAQFPLEQSPISFGGDSEATEEHQITFVSALTDAALSLAATGGFDYAWASFIKNGKFTDPRKK
jgi:pimeloyl-ACP methyl ester carboxylesterase